MDLCQHEDWCHVTHFLAQSSVRSAGMKHMYEYVLTNLLVFRTYLSVCFEMMMMISVLPGLSLWDEAMRSIWFPASVTSFMQVVSRNYLWAALQHQTKKKGTFGFLLQRLTISWRIRMMLVLWLRNQNVFTWADFGGPSKMCCSMLYLFLSFTP